MEHPKKSLANRFLGFEHFDLRQYTSLQPSAVRGVEPLAEELVRQEERQRLRDMISQFDLLLEDSGGSKNFKFWRGYLGDKLTQHRNHPGFIASLNQPRAKEISAALDFLAELEGKDTQEKAHLVMEELDKQPSLVYFLPALDNGTLLAISQAGVDIPPEATLRGLTEFIELLKVFTPLVDRIIEEGKASTDSGAQELTKFLSRVDFDEKADLDLFFNLLRDADRDTATRVVAALEDSLLRSLLEPIPARLRFLLTLERLLESLNINSEAPPKQLAQGITDMVVNTSGNFRIDEPFQDEMYQVVAARDAKDPIETLRIIRDSTFPIERFVLVHPKEASLILGADVDVTADLVEDSDPVFFPPARFVYRLIAAGLPWTGGQGSPAAAPEGRKAASYRIAGPLCLRRQAAGPGTHPAHFPKGRRPVPRPPDGA